MLRQIAAGGDCTKTRFGCQNCFENTVDAKATDIKLEL
jgi:hypothetical protein